MPAPQWSSIGLRSRLRGSYCSGGWQSLQTYVVVRPIAKLGQLSINFPHIVGIQAQKCILILSKYFSAHHPVMFNGKYPFPPSREAWEISLPGISCFLGISVVREFPEVWEIPELREISEIWEFPRRFSGNFLYFGNFP